MREVERLQKEYEDKLQDESQSSGRDLALEEDQVIRRRKITINTIDFYIR